MDISIIRKKEQAGSLKQNYHGLVKWLWPNIKEAREQRVGQYRNLAIFLGFIVIVTTFEDKIKSYLEVDSDAIYKV